jgi:hypothetical protein
MGGGCTSLAVRVPLVTSVTRACGNRIAAGRSDRRPPRPAALRGMWAHPPGRSCPLRAVLGGSGGGPSGDRARATRARPRGRLFAIRGHRARDRPWAQVRAQAVPCSGRRRRHAGRVAVERGRRCAGSRTGRAVAVAVARLRSGGGDRARGWRPHGAAARRLPAAWPRSPAGGAEEVRSPRRPAEDVGGGALPAACASRGRRLDDRRHALGLRASAPRGRCAQGRCAHAGTNDLDIRSLAETRRRA